MEIHLFIDTDKTFLLYKYLNDYLHLIRSRFGLLDDFLLVRRIKKMSFIKRFDIPGQLLFVIAEGLTMCRQSYAMLFLDEFALRIVALDALPMEMVDICYDAQTSGGLLIAIAEKDADKFLKALHIAGISAAAIIGKVIEKGSGIVHIKKNGKRKIPSPSLADKPVVTNDEGRYSEVPCCADAVTSDQSIAGQDSEIAQINAIFTDFLIAASSPHGLDAYTKQSMAIALSVATRCEPCLKMHLKKAKEKGFTQDEIDEAAWMGISLAGSPAIIFYEQHKNY